MNCEKCGRKLDAEDTIWLELNCITGEWRDGSKPAFKPEESQGWFPFGKACAANIKRKTR